MASNERIPVWPALAVVGGSIAATLGTAAAVGSRMAVAVVAVLGTGYTIGGLFWGAAAVRTEYRQLRTDLEQIERIGREPAATSEEQRARMDAVRPPSTLFLHMPYLLDWMRMKILEQAVSDLGVPLGLTLFGVLLSTVAAVWALWV